MATNHSLDSRDPDDSGLSRKKERFCFKEQGNLGGTARPEAPSQFIIFWCIEAGFLK
jgi:hypothetical protein